ncbi:helix-turn-helix transcriptional regulator [Chroococcidiopsis sp. FACHB-1243]|uniref:helix-turn-helix transcriptional regulator n=1 Tax=Chroococcidiopsis sp. [FACHB-1243] TaxID=2692781 RepID=UPI00178440C9|nr:AraC family transcriptional regulator [Chroococcidiopsis sp. [FACHB-1243]]MBD2305310.1 helix-turn-helix transcriptional regulator [Chroococcidiopsis sp. [FACHB-1243]]
METLNEAQYEQRHLESCQDYELILNTKGYDCIEKYCDRYVKKKCREILLPSGNNLQILDLTWLHDLSTEVEHDCAETLTAKFYLAGNLRTITPGIKDKYVKDDYLEKTGENYLFYLPEIAEIEQAKAETAEILIRITFDLNFFRSFNTDSESLPEPLQSLLETDTPPRFHLPVGKITPPMHLALQQILHCPHQGVMQRMYLESKVLELLSLQLTQLVESYGKRQANSLKPTDVERIYQAREILIQHQVNPPALIDLAQQVGLNHMKLEQGFRAIFGTTVFGYLRDYRLQQAYVLLRDGKLNVETVAHKVGYSHLGHFANAFRRKFGITPGACRAGKKIVTEL